VHQQPQDDLDVQITDLPGGPEKATPPRSGVRARFTARQRKLQRVDFKSGGYRGRYTETADGSRARLWQAKTIGEREGG